MKRGCPCDHREIATSMLPPKLLPTGVLEKIIEITKIFKLPLIKQIQASVIRLIAAKPAFLPSRTCSISRLGGPLVDFAQRGV